MTSDCDFERSGAVSSKKKTKRKIGSISNYTSKERLAAENDRKSTVAMFLARGLANFLKLQVDSCKELEDNYDEAIIGSIPDDDSTCASDTGYVEDTLTDEGGTERYAWWH